MTAAEIPAAASNLSPRELFRRQPQLALFGAVLVALSAITLALQVFDHRLLHDVNVWVKPTKFLFSIGVFALTGAWFFGYVRPERRKSAPMGYVVWATITAGSFELIYICLQAARGLDSHFNFASPFYIGMYMLMGVGAVVLISSTLPLAWEIARRPRPDLRGDYVAAVALGLVLTFLLGGGLGGYMSSTLGHAIGPEQGQFPVFGWNRIGGDLRVAHFFGMHLEQALPMLAAFVAPLPRIARWTTILLGAAIGVAVTFAAFAQAMLGHPFLPWLA